MWWWIDGGWTVFRMLLMMTVCWLLIVTVVFTVGRALRDRRTTDAPEDEAHVPESRQAAA